MVHSASYSFLLVTSFYNPQCKIFPNESFGYWKITVDRPLRLTVDLSAPALKQFREACAAQKDETLSKVIDRVAKTIGSGPHANYNIFVDAVKADAEEHKIKLTPKRLAFVQDHLANRDEAAQPVVRKKTKLKKDEPLPENAALYGRYRIEKDDKEFVVEFEPDSELRDTEQIPLLDEGGIEAFFRREVLPHVPDAWIDADKTIIGYEIPFTRYFYQYQPLRSLKEIAVDIRALEKETEGLLEGITEGVA